MFPPAGPGGLSGAGESWHGLADSELGLRVGVKFTARVAAAELPLAVMSIAGPGAAAAGPPMRRVPRPAASRPPASSGILYPYGPGPGP
jgi:hypothetical protein